MDDSGIEYSRDGDKMFRGMAIQDGVPEVDFLKFDPRE
jgi:hypothetical protein